MPLDAATFSDIKNIYVEEISSLIEQMGKEITLYFDDTVSNVGSSYEDNLNRDLKLPSYKGTTNTPAPTVTENTEIIKGLIRYNPRDFFDFGLKINKSANVLRVKTYLYHIPSLIRAKYIIPSQSKDIIYSKFRLIGEPIPVGLGTNSFSISFWEQL